MTPEQEAQHLREAFTNADILRTTYQLQMEALHDAVDGLVAARGLHHTHEAFEALLALVVEQRKANQP